MYPRIGLDQGDGSKVDCWCVISFTDRGYVGEIGWFRILKDVFAGCDVCLGLRELLLHGNQVRRGSAVEGMLQHGVGDGWTVHRPLGKELKKLGIVEAGVRIGRCNEGRYPGWQESR